MRRAISGYVEYIDGRMLLTIAVEGCAANTIDLLAPAMIDVEWICASVCGATRETLERLVRARGLAE